MCVYQRLSCRVHPADDITLRRPALGAGPARPIHDANKSSTRLWRGTLRLDPIRAIGEGCKQTHKRVFSRRRRARLDRPLIIDTVSRSEMTSGRFGGRSSDSMRPSSDHGSRRVLRGALFSPQQQQQQHMNPYRGSGLEVVLALPQSTHHLEPVGFASKFLNL